MVRYLLAVTVAVLVSCAPAAAAEFGTKNEAVAMVKRVEAQFKKDGPEATFKAVMHKSNKDYHDRDLYVFIYGISQPNKAICVAHGLFPALVGKNLYDIKDPDGKYLVQPMVAIVEGTGSGWVNHKWPNLHGPTSFKGFARGTVVCVDRVDCQKIPWAVHVQPEHPCR
jgi:cytochrome c